jgi:uncharacterized protein (TIGR03000 family)
MMGPGRPYEGGRPYDRDRRPTPRSGSSGAASEEEAGLAPATITVHLPADARLTIDDTPTTSTTAVRRFQSPPLQEGKEYTYTLKVELRRNGTTLTTQQRIDVRPGVDTSVRLEFSDASVASR